MGKWNKRLFLKQEDPDSILNFAKKVTRLRKEAGIARILDEGVYELPNNYDKDVFAFSYIYKDKGIAVISNFRAYEVEFDFELIPGKILLCNYKDREDVSKKMLLRPFEAILLEVKKNG